VRGAASSATDKASGMADTVEQRVEGSPLAAGLVAFGAGMVIAGLIPASQTEAKAARRVQQTAQEHGQPVLDEAKAAARDVGEQLKESGAQAASEVRAAAQESASRVKDETSTGGDRGSSPSGAPSTAG
jgi:hypothetical protein